MARLPVLGGREVVRVFERLGWDVARRRGSHIVMVREGYFATRRSVPDHKEVAQGTLRRLIRQAELTVGEFVAASGR